jgi:hypothetical protein
MVKSTCPGVSMIFRLDGNTALLFLLHEIGSRLAVVNLTGLVDLAGQLQDAFRRRGLACIDVGEDTDVSV